MRTLLGAVVRRGGTLRSVLAFLAGLQKAGGGWRQLVLDRKVRELTRGNLVFPRGCEGAPNHPPTRSPPQLEGPPPGGVNQAPGAKAVARLQEAAQATRTNATAPVATTSVSLIPGTGASQPIIVVGGEAFEVTGSLVALLHHDFYERWSQFAQARCRSLPPPPGPHQRDHVVVQELAQADQGTGLWD